MTGKRIFDLLFAVPGLLLLAPILLLLSLCIKLDSTGPVLFSQKRIGRFGHPFKIFKFRTMVQDAEKLGVRVTAAKDPRITRVGYFMRKYKLDELPQLINVLKGDMSIVGPRPEVAEYVACYSEKEKAIVQSALPGITDPASVEYRNENELLAAAEDPEQEYIMKILPKKIQMYEQYVRTCSLWIDIKLIVRTLVTLVR